MPTSFSSTKSLTVLQALFPNAAAIDSRSLATALGLSPKTLDNLGDKFPIPCVRVGRCKRYRLVDIASYMDRSLGIASDATTEIGAPLAAKLSVPKRGRGRPRRSDEAKARREVAQ